mmetsp:Transcript_39919/g.97857  ORF Transcript_39919/g.97857 Transcript_39919/m.97857 type:complete len:505 (-) Transcript_39919:609-2123(-)|eukprot:CAMPEP_0198310100 /NCGR_PEP_ID=MMETSP1450-20131203/2278_1 /TAXON_ID=753684 ORGANISM="Madagascaria erythrocladiodes, Strain CCMP3234" /NCGR_SAMPLE_ID=MMETSP1450 /ASSEMBLY_ACC=CAM_ASM_001115 /LENGTH=504 /DNA_ID=CAMNT_0044012901 /DNA_START=48 /DNA_END=1562 /DNA_ORIENTATION=+
MVEAVFGAVRSTLALASAGDAEAVLWVLVVLLSIMLLALLPSRLLPPSDPKSAARAATTDTRPPSYSEGLPIIGNILSFTRNPLAFVRRAHAATGPVFTIRVAHKRLTFMVGPAAQETFFRASDDQLDSTEPYAFSVPVFGPGVVYDAPLAKRYQHFRWLSLGLRADKLRSYVDKMVAEAEAYFDEHWPGQEGTVDLLHSLSELIVLTASACLLGREVRQNLFGKVATLIHDLDMGMQPISVLAPYLPIPAHRTRDRAYKEMRDLFAGVIAGRRASGAKEDDMLQVFIDGRYRDGSVLSDAEITGNLIAGLFGGQHTSSITSTWTGMHLLRDEGVLAEVMAEQERIRGEYGEKLNFEALRKMDVLHRCMKETLRMYPPLIFLIRKVLEPRAFQNYTIPVGDYVFASPQIAGRLPEVWTQPDLWDPARMAPPRQEDRGSLFNFVGFGGGRHGCMGEQFAYLQVKTIWSVLLRKFKMEAVGPLPEPDFDGLVVFPKPPCTIRYQRL